MNPERELLIALRERQKFLQEQRDNIRDLHSVSGARERHRSLRHELKNDLKEFLESP